MFDVQPATAQWLHGRCQQSGLWSFVLMRSLLLGLMTHTGSYSRSWLIIGGKSLITLQNITILTRNNINIQHERLLVTFIKGIMVHIFFSLACCQVCAGALIAQHGELIHGQLWALSGYKHYSNVSTSWQLTRVGFLFCTSWPRGVTFRQLEFDSSHLPM